MEHLADNVKRLREQRHLTQAELAQRLEVSASFISGIETGDKTPSLKRCEQIAAALGYPLTMLLEEYR